MINAIRRPLRRLLLSMPVLLPVLTGAYYAAYLLRFDGKLPEQYTVVFLWTVPWMLAAKMVAIVWFRLHQSFSRYVTFHDLLVLALAVTCGTIGITLVDALLLPNLRIPRTVLLLDWGTTLGALAVIRGLPRLLRDGGWRVFSPATGTPALIVGANDAGEALLRTIRHSPQLDYQPVGFVDDNPSAQGRRIGGVPVVGATSDLAQLADATGALEVLITAGELPGKKVRELVELSRDVDFCVKVLPSYEQLLRGHVDVQPRSVAIEDLLRRPSVELDVDSIANWLTGRVLMVTGSAGSIGSEICRQLLKIAPRKLLLVDRSETGQFFIERELKRLGPQIDVEAVIADITDRHRMETVFEQYQPEIIFHAAAYKHVPLMESHCGEAVKNIVLATRNLVDLADEYQSSGLVMISTDKAVNPTSVMGSCKQLAEQYVQAKAATSDCRLVTVRFGNVLDSAGSVVPIFREQIARGGPITVTHPDMIRYFMMIPEAAQLVIQAGAMGQGGEIFVLDMGEPVRILDLARDMIRLSGLREGDDIEIEIVGLRPGEKLYEELYSTSEDHRRTAHAKIMVAAGEQRSLLEVMHDLNRLDDLVDEPNEVVRAVLAEIVPLHRAAPSTPRRAAA